MSDQGEVQIHEARTPDLLVRYPDLLEVQDTGDIAGVELALAGREQGLSFRPNIVFTMTESPTPLVDASMASMLAAGQLQPGARLISLDVFQDRSSFPIGRILTFTYPGTEVLDVMVKKWVIATGTRHLHATASFLPSQALIVEETFDWIAANLEFIADADAIKAAAVAPSQAGTPIDETRTARAGLPLEDLSVIPTSEPRSGRPVPVSGIRVLMEAAGVSLDQPQVFSLTVTRAAAQGLYVAYQTNNGLMAIRSSGISVHTMAASEMETYPLSAEQLPADAAAWLGIAPQFRFDETLTVSPEEYERNTATTCETDQWTEVLMELKGRYLRIVHIHDQGYFEAIKPEEKRIELRPLPSARLFDMILRRIDSSLGSDDGTEQRPRP